MVRRALQARYRAGPPRPVLLPAPSFHLPFSYPVVFPLVRRSLVPLLSRCSLLCIFVQTGVDLVVVFSLRYSRSGQMS